MTTHCTPTNEGGDWIPVTESKPNDLQRVLVVQAFVSARGIDTAEYLASLDGWEMSLGFVYYNITHWQPLPSLPSESPDLLDKPQQIGYDESS